MVWYRQAYGQQTQVHFINGILNAQRNRDEILRNIVVPFIHDHHLMLQHDNARPHVVRICTQFLEAENITVFAWPAYSCHPLSMFGMLWIGVYDSVFQFLAISSNFTQPLKRSGPTFHRPQSTTWSTLCEGDVLHCVRHMVATPDTKWFSDPPRTPQYSKTAHFRVAFYCGQPKAHLCNNHAVYSLSAQYHRFRPLTRFRFVNNICLRSLSSAHKNGGKNKSVVYIILFSIVRNAISDAALVSEQTDRVNDSMTYKYGSFIDLCHFFKRVIESFNKPICSKTLIYSGTENCLSPPTGVTK